MYPKFANIVFNLPIEGSFTYSVPPDIESKIKPGTRVLAPFGRRNITGIVLNLSGSSKFQKVKPIVKLLDSAPVINEEMIKFCSWISEYYFCPVGEVIFSAIPKSVLIESRILYSLNKEYIKNEKVNETQERIIKALKNISLTIKQLEKKLRIGNLRASITKLLDLKVIKTEHVVTHEKIRPKKEKIVTFDLLNEFDGFSRSMMEDFAKESKISSAKQLAVLNYLIKNKIKIIGFNDLVKKASTTSSVINSLSRKDLIGTGYREVNRVPEAEFSDDEKIEELNTDQKSVLNEVTAAISKNEFAAFLLFGVTGSGKTQVYIEAIRETVTQNKNAIILVPEIALTPQLIHRFRTNFGDIIGVIHSRISEGERFDVFRRIISGEVKIVIGARSALFAPLKNIGIIIVDEEHDHSYKQSEKDPKYNARDSAIVRAKINNAVVLLGSATPSIESFHNAKTGKYKLLELPHRAMKTKQPKVEIINMREELRSVSKYVKYESPESKFLSSALVSQIGYALDKKQNIILLQNRRGYSAYLECLDCGNVCKCANCDITLIYHKLKDNLRCHYCGYAEKLPSVCIKCGSKRLLLKGTGTEKVEEEIRRVFPNARIRRMDADTVRKKDSYRKILKSFHEGEFDILVGTQMISKGLDFPNVYLVGVISADVGLFNPDFRSSEKTFQLLMQVAGRSGRSTDFGKVIIQTMHPENYIFPIVQEHDYAGFFEKEISSRSNFRYPPFSRMTLIEVRNRNASKANSLASKIYLFLRNCERTGSVEIMKPAPALIYKLKNLYRIHIILKSIKQRQDKIDVSAFSTGELITKLKSYLMKSKTNLKEQVLIEADPLSFY